MIEGVQPEGPLSFDFVVQRPRPARGWTTFGAMRRNGEWTDPSERRWHGYTSRGLFVAGLVLTAAILGLNTFLLAGRPYAGSLSADGWPSKPVAVAVVVLQAAALALPRARLPGTVLSIVGASTLVYAPDFATGYIPHVVAFFAAGAYASRQLQRLAWIYVGAFAAFAGVATVAGLVRPAAARWPVVIVAVLASCVLAGGRSQEMQRSARAAMALAERERAEELRRTVAEERSRIARELHDVLAHSVSVISVQARAAGSVMDSDPERARTAISSIESLARQSMDEIRRLLGVLRSDDSQSSPLGPQPGLAELSELAEQTTAAGVRVHLEVETTDEPLPPGLELCAYRIVQESLTNVLKHAGASSATVIVSRRAGDLVLEITDDGTPLPTPSRVGHGLIGMRERVAVFGGELETGHSPEGGWRVLARLPVGGN